MDQILYIGPLHHLGAPGTAAVHSGASEPALAGIPLANYNALGRHKGGSPMLDPKQLDEFARRFSESLPPGMRDFQQEVEKNARAVMQSAFARMDLITRDEFDAQAKTLARTRARLQELEQQVAAIESTLKTSGPGEPTMGKAADKPAAHRARSIGKDPQANSD